MEQIEQTITTVEIAEMMKTEHFEVLKKLEGAKDRKGIIDILSDNQMSVADYFQESTYQDAQGKPRKCYKVTKLGCDFLANKFTGEKGILFTAKYVKRFHDMEETIKNGAIPTKGDKEKVLLMNARSRMANTYMRLANTETLSKEYKNILVSKAAEVLSGQELLPLPKQEKRTYSATEIGEILGISSQKVGKIANAHNLKTEEYGEFYRDKSRYSSKEVDSFRYYENGIDAIRCYL